MASVLSSSGCLAARSPAAESHRACPRLGASAKRVTCAAHCSADNGNSESQVTHTENFAATKRQLLSLSAGIGLSVLPSLLPLAPESVQKYIPLGDLPALAIKEVQVGNYLPGAGVDNLVVFQAGPKDTPALRAGNVVPYSFFLPPTWTQQRVANILSGNYCQPKCAEPWIEVKFEDPKQGTLQVVAAPMVRLTNKLNAAIEEIGPPETIIAALGPFVTGDSFEPEEVVDITTKNVDGQTFYKYTLETPYARSGAHNLAIATAKGESVLLLVISASDRQWDSSEPLLRKLVDSFKV